MISPKLFGNSQIPAKELHQLWEEASDRIYLRFLQNPSTVLCFQVWSLGGTSILSPKTYWGTAVQSRGYASSRQERGRCRLSC